MKLSELAERIDAELIGDGAIEIASVGPLDNSRAGQVSFLANAKYIKQLETTGASAVIVGKSVRVDNVPLLVTRDPYLAFSKAIVALHGYRQHPFSGVHPKAFVEPTASIGAGTVVYPGAYVGHRVAIGRDSIIYPNVVIYEDCVIGDRCIIHGGAVIGADGYGFASSSGEHHKIPQIGNVVIEDDVEIGPGTTISRAALESTVIGKGTKIDQQVVIGHNVKIGQHCLIVAQVAIAGSTTVGHHTTLAGQVGVAGHLTIGDKVTVGAQSGVMHDLEEPGIYAGTPAMPFAHARRVYSIFSELPELQKRIKELEARVEELTADGPEIV
ncbi:MAG TPA: UDP-3-O-(3-hydroxymyristoyl)glucosamine N-acyltransferase [Tepidisphaeraceae bacterium]|nr:UDP-3-O-(3-hydroxymyristoyl)glucosamine N-acyltransferase [Tepidisphaeraceae bacterium]